MYCAHTVCTVPIQYACSASALPSDACALFSFNTTVDQSIFPLFSAFCRAGCSFSIHNVQKHSYTLVHCSCSRHSGDNSSKSLSRRISWKLKQFLATRVGAQAALLCLVLLMTSLVLGDGVLTPAQSVLGAVYGLQIKTSVSEGGVCWCHAQQYVAI